MTERWLEDELVFRSLPYASARDLLLEEGGPCLAELLPEEETEEGRELLQDARRLLLREFPAAERAERGEIEAGLAEGEGEEGEEQRLFKLARAAVAERERLARNRQVVLTLGDWQTLADFVALYGSEEQADELYRYYKLRESGDGDGRALAEPPARANVRQFAEVVHLPGSPLW